MRADVLRVALRTGIFRDRTNLKETLFRKTGSRQGKIRRLTDKKGVESGQSGRD
jgi:hypothetical protein